MGVLVTHRASYGGLIKILKDPEWPGISIVSRIKLSRTNHDSQSESDKSFRFDTDILKLDFDSAKQKRNKEYTDFFNNYKHGKHKIK